MRMRLVLAGVGSALLTACSGTASSAMIVGGRVDLGPLCPVERADSPCPVPPEAFADVEAVATQGEAQVRAPVAGDGSFTLTLTEGSWDVTATAGMSCSPVTVRSAGSITISCDTGIR